MEIVKEGRKFFLKKIKNELSRVGFTWDLILKFFLSLSLSAFVSPSLSAFVSPSLSLSIRSSLCVLLFLSLFLCDRDYLIISYTPEFQSVTTDTCEVSRNRWLLLFIIIMIFMSFDAFL